MSVPNYDLRTPRPYSGLRGLLPTRLSALKLRNFKSVRSAKVPIKPLTIVAGSNSAGKSSLLQAILALAQVSRRRIDGNRFPLNDDLVKLGTFTALRHQKSSEEEPVEIALEFESQLQNLTMYTYPGSRLRSNRDRFKQKSEEEEYFKFKWSIELDSQFEDQVGSAQISALCISIDTDAEYKHLARVTRFEEQVIRSEETAYLEPTLHHDEKDSLIYHGKISYRPINEEGDGYLDGQEKIDIADTAISSGQIAYFFVSPPDPFERVNEWFIEIENEPNGEPHELQDPDGEVVKLSGAFIRMAIRAISRNRPARNYPEIIELYREFNHKSQEKIKNQIIEHFIEQKNDGALDRLDNEIIAHLEEAQRSCATYLENSIYYVGPLRRAPHLPFTSAPDPDTGSVGVSGEYVAAVLQAKRGLKRQYPLPQGQDIEPLTLGEAVNRWLRFLEIADSLTVSEGTPLVYNIDLVPQGLDNKVPLKAVGVGVSQILPIIVQCLVAGPGALVILEQPELHLHPAAQQRLADFLIACTDWGQHILIESHSEYLVLRMRRRVAEDLSNKLRDQIGVLFAERDEQGNTTYREVEITDAGGVVEWPEGFFDQSQDEAHELLIAAVNRQQQAEKTTKPSSLA